MFATRLLTVVLFVFALALGQTAIAGSDIQLTSPNGFPIAGTDGVTCNCTFFADAYAYKQGWTLKFTKAGNAKDWVSQVTNANKSFVPTAGSIMVLGAFPDSSLGHVSYVTASTKNKDGSYTITVMEGFARNPVYGKVNGKWNYYQHTWTVSSGSAPTAVVSGGSTKIPVLGFLTKK